MSWTCRPSTSSAALGVAVLPILASFARGDEEAMNQASNTALQTSAASLELQNFKKLLSERLSEVLDRAFAWIVQSVVTVAVL